MKEDAAVLTDKSTNCPACNANLVDKEIPKESRHYYLGFRKDENGKYVEQEDDGRPLYYYRTIGIYDMDRDRTVAFRCPDCGFQSTK